MDTIHKAGALIFSNKRMMVVRPKGKEFFLSPGGKFEGSETAEECLRREIMEELSVKVNSYRPYKIYDIGKAATSNRPLKLELYFVEIDGEPKPSSEIELIAWITKEDFEAKKYNLAPSFNEVIPDLIKEGFL